MINMAIHTVHLTDRDEALIARYTQETGKSFEQLALSAIKDHIASDYFGVAAAKQAAEGQRHIG